MSSPSALPSVATRVLAFAAIAVSGLCGGLIGYAFVDLQCEGDCTLATGGAAIIGAAVAAGGVGLVVVLVLRAMGEWQTVKDRSDAPGSRPPDGSRPGSSGRGAEGSR